MEGKKIIKGTACPLQEDEFCGDWCEWFVAGGKEGTCIVHLLLHELGEIVRGIISQIP